MYTTLSGQGATRPKCRIWAAGSVNVNRRTSSTPIDVNAASHQNTALGACSPCPLRVYFIRETIEPRAA